MMVDANSLKYIYAYIHTIYISSNPPKYTHTHTNIYTHTYIIHTSITVTFDTETNFPAVSWNTLLLEEMMNMKLR